MPVLGRRFFKFSGYYFGRLTRTETAFPPNPTALTRTCLSLFGALLTEENGTDMNSWFCNISTASSRLKVPEAPKVCHIFHLLDVSAGRFSPKTAFIAYISERSPLIVPGACITIASISIKLKFPIAIFIDF